jgi:hypothetical protein
MLVDRSQRTIVAAGVDYLTASTKTGEGRKAYERIAYWELRKEESRGNEPKTYSAHGGQGLRCGSVDFLAHPDYYMLRLSSHLAHERYKEVIEHSTNVSRLDLQATVQFEPKQDHLAEIVERHMLRHKKERGTKLEIELRRNDVKGKTLYAGTRQSDIYSRLYDKGRESKLEEYAGCWRLENQFNDRRAKKEAALLLRAHNATEYCVGVVSTYYSRRGAQIVNSRLRIPPYCNIRPEFGETSTGGYDWLRKQVRPWVEREVAKGNLFRVLDALGLQIAHLELLCNQQRKEQD